MEIERKWLVNGWPADLAASGVQYMRQGYISVSPTVRIREEKPEGGEPRYILCFKKTVSSMEHDELEFPVGKENFDRLEKWIGRPLIEKERREYTLSGGLVLEVNSVDPGRDTAFYYAEIEFPDLKSAEAFHSEDPFFEREVTGTKGFSMGEYWLKTR